MIQPYRHISSAVEGAKQRVRRRLKREEVSLKFPWKKFNQLHLGGMEWGMLMTAAGLSGAGKTLFMGQIYREIFDLNPENDFAVALFNFEMVGERLIIRDAIAKTGMDKDKILTANGSFMGEHDLRVLEEVWDSETYKKPIYLIEKPCTPTDYVDTIEDIYKKTGKRVLGISDHSLLFKGDKESDTERKVLVDLALNIIEQKNEGYSSHIVLTQLNREMETATRRTPCSPLNYPDKSCIFGSDALYQGSDTVLAIHRPAMLNFNGLTYGPDKLATGVDDIYFHYLKLRDGDMGYISEMKADFKNMRILDKGI
ncbi:MAG: hypothetical protein E6Q36_10090 [Chryseobacterium sp.]|nr:MAG: hypothetical protein E6Q36_10090 [Chryseobacterium sp.]